MDVTIVVATFGDESWIDLACKRAIPSALRQGVFVDHRHGATLAEARNAGLADVTTEWVIHLDADDQLAPGYVAAMADATGDLRAPALIEVHEDGHERRVHLADRDMDSMNSCCIGTAIRRDLALDIGGFWSEPAWEDFSFFRRAWLSGAVIEHVPDAVYRAYVTPRSRNRSVSNPSALMASIKASHAAWMKERANA